MDIQALVTGKCELYCSVRLVKAVRWPGVFIPAGYILGTGSCASSGFSFEQGIFRPCSMVADHLTLPQ